MNNDFRDSNKELNLHDKDARQVVLWFVGFCLVLIGIGAAKMLSFHNQIKGMVQTVATVKNCELTESGDYRSTVEFTVAGEPFTAAIEGYNGIGAALQIAYDAQDPAHPVLTGTSRMLHKGLIGIIGAALLLSLTLALIKSSLRRRRQPNPERDEEPEEPEDD